MGNKSNVIKETDMTDTTGKIDIIDTVDAANTNSTNVAKKTEPYEFSIKFDTNNCIPCDELNGLLESFSIDDLLDEDDKKGITKSGSLFHNFMSYCQYQQHDLTLLTMKGDALSDYIEAEEIVYKVDAKINDTEVKIETGANVSSAKYEGELLLDMNNVRVIGLKVGLHDVKILGIDSIPHMPCPDMSNIPNIDPTILSRLNTYCNKSNAISQNQTE